MHDGHGFPSWTYSELSFQALSELPEYCVNQNDKKKFCPTCMYRTNFVPVMWFLLT
jgi:hypothetical protein